MRIVKYNIFNNFFLFFYSQSTVSNIFPIMMQRLINVAQCINAT